MSVLVGGRAAFGFGKFNGSTSISISPSAAEKLGIVVGDRVKLVKLADGQYEIIVGEDGCKVYKMGRSQSVYFKIPYDLGDHGSYDEEYGDGTVRFSLQKKLKVRKKKK
jgi:hypothetical protein